MPGSSADAGIFGPAYFRKFYFDARTRVTTPAEMRCRARLIAAILAQACIPVRTILDAGCGIGLLRKPFAQVLPRARYVGLEASDYLCSRFGWLRGSITDYVPRIPSDLVRLLRRTAIPRRPGGFACAREPRPADARRHSMSLL